MQQSSDKDIQVRRPVKASEAVWDRKTALRVDHNDKEQTSVSLKVLISHPGKPS